MSRSDVTMREVLLAQMYETEKDMIVKGRDAAIDQWSRTWKDTVKAKRKVESERDTYREALARIASPMGLLSGDACGRIAREALQRAGGNYAMQ